MWTADFVYFENKNVFELLSFTPPTLKMNKTVQTTVFSHFGPISELSSFTIYRLSGSSVYPSTYQLNNYPTEERKKNNP